MASKSAVQPHEFERPVLDLSGELLRGALQTMVSGSEEHGGCADGLKRQHDSHADHPRITCGFRLLPPYGIPDADGNRAGKFAENYFNGRCDYH